MKVNGSTKVNKEYLPAATDLGGQICRLRRDMRMTQQEFGDALGYCMITICRWESGACCPPVTALIKMASLFSQTIYVRPHLWKPLTGETK